MSKNVDEMTPSEKMRHWMDIVEEGGVEVLSEDNQSITFKVKKSKPDA